MHSATHFSKRSLKERVVHALVFELLALSICTPLLSWLMDSPVGHMGVMTLVFSLIAMFWNMFFNLLFDAVQRCMGFYRGFWVRVVHALLFELGLTVILVPIAAWWLSISLLAALLLDIGLSLFFLPYTLGFNWLYDSLRATLLNRLRTLPAAYR
jgi:uncharacterized membrane protein